MSKSGKKPVIETVGEKRVFTDGTRNVEIYHVRGLPHVEGMLVAYLPKEKILAYADMFNAPPAATPVPNPPVVGTQVFVANVVDQMKLDFDTVVSVHAPTPDRDYTKAEILKSLGRNN
jgi:hypothetical protein